MTAPVRRGVARVGAAALLLATSCASALPVERAYGGRVVEGRYIEPAAYAAFLRGAMAEAAGDAKGALAAYTEAARLDPTSSEAWSRIASLRCAIGGRDPEVRAAVDRAHAIDPGYAEAGSSLSGCGGADADVARASPDRERAIAMTLAAPDPATAWNALLAWARERDDLAVEALALGRVAAIDPSRRDAVASAAEDLAGLGDVVAARVVAAAAFDTVEAPMSDGRASLARRLAVDEAISRRDPAATRTRTTRTRIGLGEAAARALLQGQPALAVDLANERARADPDDLAARLVLAAAGRAGGVAAAWRDPFKAGASIRSGAHAGSLPAAVWVAFGRAGVRSLGPGDTRRALGGVTRDAVVVGDDDVSRGAVALAMARVIDERDLSRDGAMELAVIRGAALPEGAPPDADGLDLRHRYLMLALTAPRSKVAKDLGARLRHVAPDDRVVVAALAVARLGSDAPIESDAAVALLARDPGDPLLVAVALRLATKVGDTATAEKARASLPLVAGEGG